MMTQIWITGIATVALIASGLLHGYETDRWGLAPDPTEAAATLQNIPANIGDWGSRALELSERELQMTQTSGYFYRRYVNRVDGSAVTVLILCGPTGPIAIHPPTVCFTGAGYELKSEQSRIEIEGSPSAACELWVGNFSKPSSAVPNDLRVYWGWSTDGVWRAPDYPRLTFAGEPVLFKIYVTQSTMPAKGAEEQNPAAGFLQEFLPVVAQTLLENSQAAGAANLVQHSPGD